MVLCRDRSRIDQPKIQDRINPHTILYLGPEEGATTLTASYFLQILSRMNYEAKL